MKNIIIFITILILIISCTSNPAYVYVLSLKDLTIEKIETGIKEEKIA